MTNVTGVQVNKITVSAPVLLEFDRKLRIAVAERGVSSKADAIRQAVAYWVRVPFCPQCEQPTIEHPDPTMVGVRYCEGCGEPVLFGNGGQAVVAE